MNYSITRLLVLKKSVEKQLDTLLETQAANITTTVKASASSTEKTKMRTRQQSLIDQLDAAFKKRNIIAEAIANSNANTKVEVGGTTMTVTAAIDRKNNLNREKLYINLLGSALNRVTMDLTRAERAIEEEASSRAQILSGRDKVVTQEALSLAKSSVEDLYKLEVVEPVDIAKLIETKRKELDAFSEEIDIVLNESNATTLVELALGV